MSGDDNPEAPLLVRTVGATRRSFWGMYGMASLTITRGHVVLSARFSLAAVSGLGRLDHTTTDVHVVTFRAGIPWARTFLIMHEGTTTAAVGLGPWLSRRMRAALERAGFRVVETKAWFPHGDFDAWVGERGG